MRYSLLCGSQDVFVSAVLYALLFPVLYPSIGLTAATLNAIPAIAFGWFLGARGGLLYAVFAMPINIFLFTLVGSGNSGLLPNIVGTGAFMSASVGIGWVRDLNHRVNEQTQALYAERKLLQDEIVRRTRAEEKLAHEALHDPLTELPNRRLFFDRLRHAYAWSKRNPDNLCAVLYLDLNKFKTTNDSMGHEAGDHLLQQVAGRLKSYVRDIDTVARMGGDEFAILLEAASSPEDVTIIAQRIQSGLALPYDLQGRKIVSGASIGIVMSIAAYKQLDDILHDADTAMYNAKAGGGNRFKVSGVEM